MVISDLVFSSRLHKETWSVEVKKITAKRMNGTGPMSFIVTRPLSFSQDFSITTLPHEEFPHQLERQVMLCRRLGWKAVLLLFVVQPKGWPKKYLFSSEKLYKYWKAGHAYLPSEFFEEFHDPALADLLTRGDASWIKTTSPKQKRKRRSKKKVTNA